MDPQLVSFELGIDTGDTDAAAIAPVMDGENAVQAVFQRPSENLRQRTEVLRAAVQDLNYLADADRAFCLSGARTLQWQGPTADGGATKGAFGVGGDPIVVRPFLAPLTSAPGSLDLGGIQLTCHTAPVVVNGISANPLRAYGRLGDTIPGANHYSVEVVLGSALDLSRYGDLRHWLITITSSTTVAQLFAFLSGLATDDGFELQRRYDLTKTASDATLISAFPKTYFTNARDAEVHTVTNQTLAAFFATPANRMIEGDVLLIRYDALTSPSGGGRRQSLAEPPESNSNIPVGSLFLLRNHPEWGSNALPLARVISGNLVLPNGRAYLPGSIGAVFDGADVLLGSTLALHGATQQSPARISFTGVFNRPRTVDLTYENVNALFASAGRDASAYHSHNLPLYTPLANRSGFAADVPLGPGGGGSLAFQIFVQNAGFYFIELFHHLEFSVSGNPTTDSVNLEVRWSLGAGQPPFAVDSFSIAANRAFSELKTVSRLNLPAGASQLTFALAVVAIAGAPNASLLSVTSYAQVS